MTDLRLVRGFYSLRSLGSTNTFESPAPQTLDMLNGTAKLQDANGITDWQLALPELKGGGVWSDPAGADGRSLVAAFDDTVTETFMLLIPATETEQVKYATVASYREFAKAARDWFVTDSALDPVYLQLQPARWSGTAAGYQYAFVYNIDVAVSWDATVAGQGVIITLRVEREPYWRVGVPPGGNPKLWTFEQRGMKPTTTNPAPSASFYSRNELNIAWDGSSSWNSLVEATFVPYDQLSITNKPYIDIPASLIPGDAEALALVSLENQLDRLRTFMVSRDTKPDYVPNANFAISSAGLLSDRQKRHTLNGGDAGFLPGTSWTLFALAGAPVSGTTSTQQVARHNSAASTTGDSISWEVRASQWRGRYAVFVRTAIQTGNSNNFTLSFSANELRNLLGADILDTTPDVNIINNGISTTFLGIIAPNRLGNAQRNRYGEITESLMEFRLTIKKANAVSVDLRVYDVVLMPIDEPSGVITPTNAFVSSEAIHFIDSTAFLHPYDPLGSIAAIGAYHVTSAMDVPFRPMNWRGVPIVLTPNVDNRLCFLMYPPPGDSERSTPWRIRVDIVPRTAGLRGF
jgi:hypothetical protein